MPIQTPSIDLTCPDCGTEMIVVPPTLGHFRRERDAPVIVSPPVVRPGQVEVHTDEEGKFACPNSECSFASDWDTLVAADSAD
jgi:predicted RNA-binding Zn-ribbon protein involved in translation (DUF1610 family)